MNGRFYRNCSAPGKIIRNPLAFGLLLAHILTVCSSDPSGFHQEKHTSMFFLI